MWKIYYYHARTRETVWIKPENVKIITQEEVESLATQNQMLNANRPISAATAFAQAAGRQGQYLAVFVGVGVWRSGLAHHLHVRHVAHVAVCRGIPSCCKMTVVCFSPLLAFVSGVLFCLIQRCNSDHSGFAPCIVTMVNICIFLGGNSKWVFRM